MQIGKGGNSPALCHWGGEWKKREKVREREREREIQQSIQAGSTDVSQMNSTEQMSKNKLKSQEQ